MKSMLKLLIVSALVGMSSVGAEPTNKKCPVSGEDVDVAVSAKYTAVVGFCCKKCLAKFKENPGDVKFAKALIAGVGKPVNSKCPVSGEDVDLEKTTVIKGQTVAACCGKCVKKLNAEPEKFAGKIKADAPSNKLCPVSGEDVDASTAVAHTKEVAYCCKKCLKKANGDLTIVFGGAEAKGKK